MSLKFINKILFIAASTCCYIYTQAQPAENVIDQVAAVVGNKIIMRSDLETQYQQYISQGNYGNEDVKCRLLDQMVLNKLLLYTAIIDSVEVTDSQVEGELDKRVNYFLEQFGSQERMEEYYHKSITELKEEFRPLIKEQMQSQAMQGKITRNITVSPADVKTFYNSLQKDSLPYINAELEYAEITCRIAVSNLEKQRIKQRLEEFKERVKKGEDFATLAILYSQDPGSAKNGGELGYTPRGQLVPEFEAVAFRLKPGEISNIVETKFGFHLIMMIDRKGEKVNVRHILLKPEVNSEDLLKAKAHADSIVADIKANKISFADAAYRYSDDTDTKANGGNIINPATANTKFETAHVEATTFFQLDKLKPGEISQPVLSTLKEGTQAYKIYLLKNRTQPHVINLKDDYQRLHEAALQEKQNKTLDEWVKRKKKTTFIQIAKDYIYCDVLKSWM